MRDARSAALLAMAVALVSAGPHGAQPKGQESTKAVLTLRVIARGDSSGSVTTSMGTCRFERCTFSGRHGRTTTLVRHAGARSEFARWGGACSGTSRSCSVSLMGHRTVTARFRLSASLRDVGKSMITDGVTSLGTLAVPACNTPPLSTTEYPEKMAIVAIGDAQVLGSFMRLATARPWATYDLTRPAAGWGLHRIAATCRGRSFDPKTACCESSGLQRKNPIVDLADCPGRVARPGFRPNVNGCGPEGLGALVPDRTFDGANFTDECNQHDTCYGTCNSNKAACDRGLASSMVQECARAFPHTSGVEGIIDQERRAACVLFAREYVEKVVKYGKGAHENAQKKACDCCEGCPPGQTRCFGSCVDTQTATAHCGGCGRDCGSGQECSGGSCRVTCPAGSERCGIGCCPTANLTTVGGARCCLTRWDHRAVCVRCD